MLRPSFSRQQVADLDIVETHVGHLLQHIPGDGSTVDLQDLFFRLTIDSATEFLFGASSNMLLTGDTSNEISFDEAWTVCINEVGNRPSRLVQLNSTVSKTYHDKCIKLVYDFADKYIQEALDKKRARKEGTFPEKDLKGRFVFLDELVEQTDDPHRLRCETINILLAGRDTTASLLSEFFLIIPKRPDILSKVREEVSQLHGRRPCFGDIKNMRYLQYCLNEGK